MKNKGFIMLGRNLVEWEWYTDLNCCKLFLHCLLKVNYSSKRWQGISIAKGEFITSNEKLAVETGLSVSKVRTALKKLQLTKCLLVAPTNSYTKISIPKLGDYVVNSVEWKNHNQNDIPNDKRLASNSHSNDNQIATTNTNDINKRKIIFKERVFAHTNFNSKILNSFFQHWSQFDDEKSKMLFEYQKCFEIGNRLENWHANEKKAPLNNKTELLTNRPS